MFIDYEILKLIWWLFIGVLLAGFAVMDGQDMGGSVTLNLRVNDTLTVPSFTEITKLTEEELMNVFQSFAPGVEAIDTWLNGEAA